MVIFEGSKIIVVCKINDVITVMVVKMMIARRRRSNYSEDL